LLATALSPEGLLAARGVMKHENILRRVETEPGGQCVAARSRPLLHRVFGNSDGRALGLALRRPPPVHQRHQLPGSAPVVAPVFMGANPARVLTGPKPVSGCWPRKKTWAAS
jgi:hypothetical protein